MNTDNEIRVLMLGGAKRVSLARLLKQAAHRHGKEVSIISSEILPTVPISCEGKVVAGPKWKDDNVVQRLSATIAEEKVDIVLPFVDGAIEVCSRLKVLHPEVFIPVSDYDVAHAMYDKAEAARLFTTHDIKIPATYSPDNYCLPAIFKPRTGSASAGIIVANTEAEFAAITEKDDYLIQEYIPQREEYTVDCYVSAISGEVLCAVPRLRLATTGGEVNRTVTRRLPQLITESKRILKQLKFRGPITLQFIRDLSDDRFLLMEINPRLGGGVVCSILAGADIAEMIVRESMGIAAEAVDDWKDGALMARYFSEVMFFNQ